MDTRLQETYEAFTARQCAAGYDEVLVRDWQPGQVVDEHSHPFDASAVIARGEMWLSHGGRTEHLQPGDTFELAAGTPHAERYGPQGATYWVARRARR